MTDQTSNSADGPEPSGADLARVALQQVRLAAKDMSGEARAPRRRRPRPKSGTGGSRPGSPPYSRAGWTTELETFLPPGGTVLDRWPDIDAAAAP